MGTQVFFNRPDEPFDLKILIEEIRRANKCLAIASAWFTNREIAQAFIDSKAKQKLCIMNAGDHQREFRDTYRMVSQYFKNEDARKRQLYPGQTHGIYTLGGNDYIRADATSLMHHKFILIDFDVVWTGSYNLSYQAQQNYEAILRIQDTQVCTKFWYEAERLCFEAEYPHDENLAELIGIHGHPPGAIVGRHFKCFDCEKVLPISQLSLSENWLICNECCKK